MYPEMRYEHVVYQNPFLAVRIWQIDASMPSRSEMPRHVEQAWRNRQFSEWHYHKEAELLFILEGEMAAFCKDEKFVLGDGDIAVFGSNEPHTTIQTKEGPLSYLVFQIDLRQYWDVSTIHSMQHFSEVIRPLSSLNYVYKENAEVRMQTGALIAEIYREMNEKQLGYELAVSSRVKAMLLLLLRADSKHYLRGLDNALLERLQPALDYIEEHLDEPLTVDRLSSLLNISYTHFVKTFKKSVGMPFSGFVAYKRIKKAEQLLLTTDRSVADIADSVGMSNLGHFYDMFRRYNDCSPKQFKERMKAPFESGGNKAKRTLPAL